jgi:hypothetical protein
VFDRTVVFLRPQSYEAVPQGTTVLQSVFLDAVAEKLRGES